ncbi:MAG: hypothetical protein EOP45_16795 [Sphingobacteriaceae bacterium]|nr:MAG: hypothetical protein EOP45_16795 [Sphingobacteriaceae bacterium]
MYQLETNLDVPLEDSVQKYKGLHVDLRVWTVRFLTPYHTPYIPKPNPFYNGIGGYNPDTDPYFLPNKSDSFWMVNTWFGMKWYIHHQCSTRYNHLEIPPICLVQERTSAFDEGAPSIDANLFWQLDTGRIWHWTHDEIILGNQQVLDQRLTHIEPTSAISQTLVMNPVPLLSLKNGTYVSHDVYATLYETGSPSG